MGEKIAIYPGTFDPITWGHIEIIERASRWLDKLIIGIASNLLKKPTFDLQTRLDLVRQSVNSLPCAWKVQIFTFDNLLINFCRQHNSMMIIRGLRGVSDFELEFQMALVNNSLDQSIETVFFMTSEKRRFISSSLVKEVFMLGGDVSSFVPIHVIEALKKYLSS